MITLNLGNLYTHHVYTLDGKPDSFHIYSDEIDDKFGKDDERYHLYAGDIFLCLEAKIGMDFVNCKILTSAGIIGRIFFNKRFLDRFILVNGAE
jgi:hypothetical protein